MPASRSKSKPSAARTTCVALLRGINVGKAKRIAMADLRELVEGLGGTNVRTLLNSGNVVFEPGRLSATEMAAAIDRELQRQHGFSANVIVVTGADLKAIVRDNPLVKTATDPSRHLVAFVMERAALRKARSLLTTDWKPDVVAVGARAAYLWCATGILQSKLLDGFSRTMDRRVTTRNWATVLKLQALLGEK